MSRLFLGIDASTQSLTGTIIDPDNPTNVVSESVNFEMDLPQYGTKAGSVSSPENNLEFWSYPTMWLDALDMLLAKLQKKVNFSEVVAISGSGQQHASVWLNSQNAFQELAKSKKGDLAKNLKKFLSRQKSPIWMDKSTFLECKEITSNAGSQAYVLEVTGSVATERFTAAQIRKIFKNEPDVYKATKRIHLNSSFFCSVFAGCDAPIDFGDGAGMNLLNLQLGKWDAKMLEATAENLYEKLPRVENCKIIVGNISRYFVDNYGFDKDAKVCIFTGDNPSSLVGIGASSEGNAIISLGTSDTFFCSNQNYKPVENAHVFGNPSGGYMNLICFRNGSLARESVKKSLSVDWGFFDDKAFENYSPKDDDKFILPFCFDEISPKISADKIEYKGDINSKSDSKSVIRYFLEGQFFNMRLQARKMGASPTRIILTGGAAKSNSIAQCVADVFATPVFLLESVQNSAAMGAAIRAAEIESSVALNLLERNFCKKNLFKVPNENAVEVYASKIEKFAKILNQRFNIIC